MWETIRNLTASDLAAWYAAFISTMALGWEIIKYIQQGIELKVSAWEDMVVAEGQRQKYGHRGHGQKYVLVTVKHVSGPPTTITHVGVRKFHSRWHKLLSYNCPSWLQYLFRKTGLSEGHEAAVVAESPGCEYPTELDIGNEWKCYFEQSKLQELSDWDLTYIFVAHTLQEKEELVLLERHQ